MALTPVQTPTFAGSVEAGQKRQNSNNLSLVGFQKPDWDTELFRQTRKYYLQEYIVSRGGDGGTTGQESWNWTEVGKAYRRQEVISAVDNGANNFTVELNNTTQYYIPTDVVMFGIAHPQKPGMNVMMRVESVGVNGGNQTITGTLVGNVTVGTVTAPAFTGVNSACITNTQVECFELPQPKNYSPEQYSNSLMKISNRYSYCDDASNTTMWFKASSGRHYWVDEEEMIMGWERHRCLVDGGLLWGQDHTATDTANYTANPGKGILQFLSEGSLIQTFAASFVEADLINYITLLGTYAKGKEFDLICGWQLHRDLLNSMDRYYTGGGVNYGTFRPYPGQDVGLSVAKYHFGNLSVNIMQYDPFGDPDFLPTEGVNYANFGIFLNTADQHIKLKWRKDRNGGKVKDFLSRRHGHSIDAKTKTFANDRACEDRVYTCNVGVSVKGLQSQGLVYPT